METHNNFTKNLKFGLATVNGNLILRDILVSVLAVLFSNEEGPDLFNNNAIWE